MVRFSFIFHSLGGSLKSLESLTSLESRENGLFSPKRFWYFGFPLKFAFGGRPCDASSPVFEGEAGKPMAGRMVRLKPGGVPGCWRERLRAVEES